MLQKNIEVPLRDEAQALLKTDALQRAIFNSIHFSCIATDANGVIQIFNVGAERMLGYTADEIINKITPSDLSLPQELIARAAELTTELGTPITPGFEALVFKASRSIEDIYPLTYVRKDGSRLTAIVSVTALRDAHEAIIGYLLIGTDNTLRKQAEEALLAEDALLKASSELEQLRIEKALRKSYEHYCTLFESINEGFCIIEKIGDEANESLDFRYVEANPAFVVQTGLHDVVGKTVRQVAPDALEEWLVTYNNVLRTGEPIRFEHSFGTSDRVSELHAFRLKDASQQRIAINLKDITERKRVEAALRESEAFNRSIIDSSPDCIKVLDLQGNMLSMVSGQALLGVEDITPFLNTSWIDFWLVADDRRAAQAAVEMASQGATGNFVGFFRTFHDEPKWWEVTVSPILDRDGQTQQLLCVSRDITRRRRAEMNLEFLASISQELTRWNSVDELLQNVSAKIGAFLQLSLCAFAEISEKAEQVVIEHDWHNEEVPSLVGVHPLADFAGADLLQSAQDGKIFVVRDVRADSRFALQKFTSMKIASLICVPLVRDGHWHFALYACHAVAYDWQEDEIELVRELATRIWTRLERLRVEAALFVSERRYRLLFESISDGFCIIKKVKDETDERLDFRFIEANQGFAVQSGLQNVVGKTFRQLLPDIADEWVFTYDAILRTGESIRFEQEFMTPDIKRVLELYALPIEDPGCVAVIFRDITKRKQAEEALRLSEERFRAFVTASSDAVYRMNADWTEMLQLYSRSFIANTEKTKNNWLQDYVFPDDQSQVLVAIDGAIRTKQIFTLEHRVRRVDGSIGWTFSCAVPLLDSKSEIVEWFGTASDITERKQATEALRESEWRLRYAIEAARLTYVEIDLVRGSARMAENFASVMGFASTPGHESDIAVGARTLIEHVVPADRQRVQAALQQFVNANPGHAIDYRVLGDDKVERWIETRWSVELAPDGKPLKSFATKLDITERKRAEERLWASEQHLSLITQNAPVSIIHVDTEQRLLFANPDYLHRLGKKAEEVLGKTMSEILGDANYRLIAQYLAKAMKGERQKYEICISYPAMGKRDLHIHHAPVRSPNGQVLGLVSVIEDITERKRIEKALLVSEERLRQALDSAELGTWNLDPTTGLFTCDERFKAIFGVSIEGLSQEQALANIHPDDHSRVLNAMTAATCDGDPDSYEVEYRVVHPDGLLHWVSAKGRANFSGQGAQRKLLSFAGTVADITVRKRAEQAIQQRTAQFETLLNEAPLGMYLVDSDLRIRQVNPIALKAFENISTLPGSDLGELIYKTWPKATADEILNLFRHTLQTGESYIVPELIEKRADRQVTESYEWQINRIVLPEGDYGVVCYFRDISERVIAQQKIIESEERYRNLFNSMDEGYCTIEMIFDEHLKPVDYRYLEMNPAFEKLSGISGALGKRVRELLPNLEESWFEIYGNVALTGEPIRFVNEAKPINRWFDVYSFRVGGPESRKVAILFNNITERKLAEEALRQSEELYRNLFNSIDEGFCIIEMIFDEYEKPIDFSFVETNPAFEKQTSLPNVIGKRVREIIPDLEIDWIEVYGKVALTGHPIRFVNEAKPLNRWFDIYATRIGGQENPKVGIVVNNITERKQYELKLNNAIAVAEKASRTKSDFLSSMSHELRSPLNAILGFAQLLESGHPPPTPTQQQNLNQILKGGWYLLDLINEILDLAVVESGKVIMTWESMSLGQILLECRAMIEPQASKRGISLTFPNLEVPCFVSVDHTRVKQVLINLLVNAIKYNKPNGAVTVECAVQEPDSIRISIRDTGEGLTADQLNHLFQPFNRLGKERSAVEGTGIGLVVSKRLVELMGGAIGAQSELGKGCVFWIELKLVAPPQLVIQTDEKVTPVPSALADDKFVRTLLYIEDNLSNMEMVAQLISRYNNLRLLSAGDGHAGIELARAAQPDVILMDINLPGISGMEAMRMLHADRATAHIPVVALSANALPIDIENGLAAGFFRYVTKPIKVNELIETLNVALEFAYLAHTKRVE